MQLTDLPQSPLEIRNPSPIACEIVKQGVQTWKMYFEEEYSKDSVDVGFFFISPSQEVITLYFKLEFETTNNIAKYEALVLGTRAANDMKIEELSFFGDVEIILHQVRNIYQENHPRLRIYSNEVWDLIENFFLAFNI
jgi:ribonuclease HI